MGYTPTLIILKRDLDKHRELIVNGDWQYEGTSSHKKDERTRGEDNKTVMEYIKWIYEDYKPVTISGIELVLCSPNLTAYNKSVRDKLNELEIEYAEYY